MTAQVQKIDNNKHTATASKSKYVVEILRDLCIGAASCVAIAANTFILDEENKVLIIEGEWDDDEIVLAAAQSCPVFAIIIKDAATGKQIFPEPEATAEQPSTPNPPTQPEQPVTPSQSPTLAQPSAPTQPTQPTATPQPVW